MFLPLSSCRAHERIADVGTVVQDKWKRCVGISPRIDKALEKCGLFALQLLVSGQTLRGAEGRSLPAEVS